MTPSPTETTGSSTTQQEQLCCRKPLSTIAVTTRGATLTLRSCTSCGHHVWEKDGVAADRTDLLDGVRVFLEQPRDIVRRRSAKQRAAEQAAAAAARR